MNNKNNFISNSKYNSLSETVKILIDRFDKEMENIGYSYDAVWRADREAGGNIFVFEIPLNQRNRANVKNLVTLRPQVNFLKVEVYWGKDDKHYYEVWENREFDVDMFGDIKKKYDIIGE